MTEPINQEARGPVTPARRNRLTDGPEALFVYGTLQFDAVLEALLGRVPPRTPASAQGWRAAALEERVYPGLVAAPNATTLGLLLTDLSTEEWAILDAFEDDRYDLRKVTLTSGDSGWAYIWADGDIRAEDWNADDFAARHLQQYAARCARISAELAKGAIDAVK
ncbi:gamma-glutamylcyclotransferase family protein [Peterkaempfera bronchialis]|uniref:gamma-glutamylcyclotransferase family protein n=1 Tax=Peterkaempfera bronchialis TaxID=2126346 RepID=UPI003C30495C